MNLKTKQNDGRGARNDICKEMDSEEETSRVVNGCKCESCICRLKWKYFCESMMMKMVLKLLTLAMISHYISS